MDKTCKGRKVKDHSTYLARYIAAAVDTVAQYIASC